MAKPTDLTVVHATMALENVVGVLSRTRHRITDGDLKGAQGILVIIMDAEGLFLIDKSETLTDAECLNMVTVTMHGICKGFLRDIDDGDLSA